MKICQAAAIILLSLGAIPLAFAQSDDAWSRGNQEYAAGHFREAAESYQNLIAAGDTSAALFYNLGNACYREGDFGRAILNYERALALAPQHPEAAANLSIAQDKAHALELKRNRIDHWAERFTDTQYAVAAAIAFWLAIFALAAWFFARRRSGWLVAGGICALLAGGIAGYGFFARATGPSGRALAIVTAKGTDARLATAENAGPVLALPPGSEIKILSTRGDWSYAALPNDLRGWIPAKNAERVRL